MEEKSMFLQKIKIFLLFSEVILGTAYGWLDIRDVFITWALLTIVQLAICMKTGSLEGLSAPMQDIVSRMTPPSEKEAQ